MPSPHFCRCLRDHLGFELLFDVHLAEPPVFLLKFLHARHLRRVHAAILAAPVVEGARADAKLSAQLRDGQTRLNSFEDLDDLAVCESPFLHGRDSPVTATIFRVLVLWGITQTTSSRAVKFIRKIVPGRL